MKSAAVGSASLAVLSKNSSAFAAERRKPNLLFIWTDEQRADTMAVYGNTKIHAPNLNKLASESFVFEKAYVSQPVCTPSRASVLTGLWPHTSGCTANNIPLPKDIPCLPELVNDPEYRTAYMGKWHLGDEIFAQHGFEQWESMEDGYTNYYSKGRDRSARSSYHHFLVATGYKPDSGDKFSRGFCARLPLEHCKPRFLERKACEFLRRSRSQPFILTINFLEPHMPFFGPLDKEHDPAEVDLPINFYDPLEENEPLRYRLHREQSRAKYGKTEQEIRELIARYWGLVTQVDLSVGAILNTLDELGLTDNTIVVYTSDHGDMMGAHHMVEKTVMYEEAVRVPWLMRVPHLGRRQRMIKSAVSHIDMMPTVLDLMGAKCGESLQGQSLAPLMQDGKVADDHVFIEWNPAHGGFGKFKRGTEMASKKEIERLGREHIRTVVSPDGWKLCLSDLDKCQLFNLNKDPGEAINLFDSGRHRDVIERLAREIHRWQQETKDDVRLPIQQF